MEKKKILIFKKCAIGVDILSQDVVYPNEGHGIERSPNYMDMLARIEEFMAKPLGGRSPTLGNNPGMLR
jgi:hypothetical protein